MCMLDVEQEERIHNGASTSNKGGGVLTCVHEPPGQLQQQALPVQWLLAVAQLHWFQRPAPRQACWLEWPQS